MILFILIVVLICILLLQYYQICKKVNRMKKIAGNIPGPKPLPLFGNALSLGRNSSDLLENLQKFTKQYGPTTAIWVGSDLLVYISDKEDMKAILTSNVEIKKGKMYDFMHDWIGKGLATSDGHRWRRNRKMLTPTFHFKILENYIDIFNTNYKIMTDIMETEVGNDGFNMEHYIGNCATDNLYESALRIKVGVQLNSKNKFTDSLNNIFAGIAIRTFKFWLHPRILFNLSTAGKLFNEGLDYMNNFVNKAIYDKKKALKENLSQNHKEENKDNEFTGRKKQAFLDLIIEIAADPNTYLSDEDLRHEVNTFIAAGHGTITTTLGFVFYELAHNQDVQNKAAKEIEDHFGGNKREPTYQDLQHFPYLEMVIKETLRLYPITYLGRTITQDFPLPSGYTVPAGSSLIFDWLQLQRDPAEFPNPERFNPDHFLPEKCAKRHPFAYLPFSAGPRNCIGQRYAMLSMKSGIVQILRTYKILPSEKLPKMKLGFEVLLHSSTGINVRIEKRNGIY